MWKAPQHQKQLLSNHYYNQWHVHLRLWASISPRLRSWICNQLKVNIRTQETTNLTHHWEKKQGRFLDVGEVQGTRWDYSLLKRPEESHLYSQQESQQKFSAEHDKWMSRNIGIISKRDSLTWAINVYLKSSFQICDTFSSLKTNKSN